jgi:S-adenosylmethionine:tRNA ribosyltransferase-isomerase
MDAAQGPAGPATDDPMTAQPTRPNDPGEPGRAQVSVGGGEPAPPAPAAPSRGADETPLTSSALRLADFDYELPPELVAQEPAARREDARLLVLERAADRRTHAHVRDLADWLAPGDLVVVNDTRVRRARLVALRATGGRVEVLLVERLPGAAPHWRALCRPAAKLRAGEVLQVVGGQAAIVPVERERAADGSDGLHWVVALKDSAGDDPTDEEALIERVGALPLPPYVRRDGGPRPADDERYQTVYAREVGAVAAPTAGLHLSHTLLAAIAARGVERASVTLHVGPGTFRPIESDDVRSHVMHSERYHVPAATRDAIARTRSRGGRVVAVGTTVVRTLTAAHGPDGLPRAGPGATDVFITPGRRVDAIDALLTNFHLPRSTLLVLVAALVGTQRALDLYREAVRERYRFYSYGDAMLVLP